MAEYVGAVDQGTTSSRFIIFDRKGLIVAADQKEHQQIFPRPGWVEHDPLEIWRNTEDVIQGALNKAGLKGSDLAAIGITNQRETTVIWDKHTGKPFYNAIVWQCTRTHGICKELIADGGQDRFRAITGLPVATYFSGPKMKWILDNAPEARRAVDEGRALIGTMETWIIWLLNGGPDSGSGSDPVESFEHLHTYANHPVGCRAGLKNLEILEEEELIKRSAEMGAYFLEGLKTNLEESPIVGQVRGTGCWLGIDCTADKRTKALFPMANLQSLVDRAQAKGLIIKLMGQALELAPPLVITKEEIDQGIEILRKCFAEEAREMGLA